MEQTKKNLRNSSLVVLIFAALTLLQLIGELLWGELNSAQIPAGAPENTLQITKIFLLVLTVLLLLPKVYVGVKGLRMAKKPNASKGHIVWAIILTVCTVMSIPSPISDIAQGIQVGANIMELFRLAIDILLYVTYVVCAKRVLNDAK